MIVLSSLGKLRTLGTVWTKGCCTADDVELFLLTRTLNYIENMIEWIEMMNMVMVSMYANIHIHINKCLHTYISSFINTYKHTHIHPTIQSYINTYILLYIYTYNHTYMHTYKHTNCRFYHSKFAHSTTIIHTLRSSWSARDRSYWHSCSPYYR